MREVARLVGDTHPRGPNRSQRRSYYRDINRKTVYDESAKMRRRKSPAELEQGFIPWFMQHFRTKNTPVRWALIEEG